MKATGVKERILDVSSRLFYKQGYNSTGINQIIAEADIARATLYNHFPSKNDLLHAYLEEKDTAWFDELEAFLSKKQDPKEKILGIFDFRIERQQRADFGGCLFIKISAEVSAEDTNVFQQVNKHKQRLKDYIKNCVSQLQPTKQILDIDMLTDMLYFLMEGASVTVNFQKNKEGLVCARNIAEKLI